MQQHFHPITGFYFHITKEGVKWVGYSTLYHSGRYLSWHNATGLTDEQARGKFIVEHSQEVDHLIAEKQKKENKNKIILNS